MKRLVLILFLLPVLSFAQTEKKAFVVTGKITGLADSTEVRLVNNNTKAELAKAKAVKGQFILKGSVPEAELYSLILGKPSGNNQPPTYFLYLENSNINVTGDIKSISKLKVTGSSSHSDFLIFQKKFDPLFNEIN